MTAEDFLKVTCEHDNMLRWLELVRGEVVECPPGGHRHAAVVGTLCGMIHGLTFKSRIGVGVVATGIVVRRDPDTVRVPDYAIVPLKEFRSSGPNDGITLDGFVTNTPRLVIEVVGPDDSPDVIRDKCADYRSFGVPAVWVIDPQRRQVSVLRPGQPERILGTEDNLDGEDVLPGFECPVADFFKLPAELR